MKDIGDIMRQSVEQYARNQRAGRLRRLCDLKEKKRLIILAKNLHDKGTEADLICLGLRGGIRAYLDQMYQEAEQAIDKIFRQLGNDELIQEIQARMALADRELDTMAISNNEVERIINAPLPYRKNNDEATP